MIYAIAAAVAFLCLVAWLLYRSLPPWVSDDELDRCRKEFYEQLYKSMDGH